MYLLGLSGLVDVEGFLEREFPTQLRESRIVQGMDAAAALICDGRVIAAASEERFDRTKKSSAFPFQAIDYCLREAQITLPEVDHICGNFNFGRYEAVYMKTATDDTGHRYWQQCLAPDAIRDTLARHYQLPVTFQPIDHHDTHLHSALASSGFDRCLVIVMDAAGEIGATSIYRVENGRVQRLRRHPISQSLGMFYSLITHYLGFAFNEDEYKVMGMAALAATLGDPTRYDEFFQSAIILEANGEVRIPCLTLNHGFAESVFFSASSRAIRESLGFDGRTAPLAQRAAVSAGLQKRFTEALFHIARYYRDQTGMTDLVMSGGCAENCAAVGELRTSGMFDHIHVSYGSGDDGTALGAALAHSHALGQPVRIPSQMPFYGPAPKIEVVRSLVAKHGLHLQEYPDRDVMLGEAANDIARDRIVAICDGRMEYGARALGNRSLLALPSIAANKDRINQVIKKRENYRPFAPAVTIEHASVYFDLEPAEAYPYMTMLTTVREPFRELLPAITHFDGSARVQTVDPVHNPAFHQFLMHLKQRTGVPVVLNTSYNVNHQPIVCTEEEAIATFIEMEIDALYIAGAAVRYSP
jgi:carbamoyltransferase